VRRLHCTELYINHHHYYNTASRPRGEEEAASHIRAAVADFLRITDRILNKRAMIAQIRVAFQDVSKPGSIVQHDSTPERICQCRVCHSRLFLDEETS
jgi:hypothetical protein